MFCINNLEYSYLGTASASPLEPHLKEVEGHVRIAFIDTKGKELKQH